MLDRMCRLLADESSDIDGQIGSVKWTYIRSLGATIVKQHCNGIDIVIDLVK